MSSTDAFVLQHKDHPYQPVKVYAEFLGVRVELLYAEIAKGALPAMRVGRLRLVHVHDFVKYCQPTA